MGKYINQIVAIDTILSNPPDAHYPCWFAEQIAELPAADVIEAAHGEWKTIEFYNGFARTVVECSVCKCAETGSIGTNYCPNCGAKMRCNNENN